MTSKDEPTDVQLDISKYEGHTPGPWLWREATYAHAVVEDRPCHAGFDSCYNDDCIHWAVAEKINNRATGLLIADAPLLLEEVKRQRKKIDALVDALETIAGDLVHVSSGEDVARIAQFADEMSGLI